MDDQLGDHPRVFHIQIPGHPNQDPWGRTGKWVVSGFLDSFRVWGQLLFVLQRKKISLFQTIGGQ
jgi:hypothetical protein